ncbi:MAG: hypothetical protein RL187_341 [Actinomycetota bacterium]
MLRLVLAGLLVIPAFQALPPEGACDVQEVSVTWGFKESFRSYISGSIAQGTWAVSGDVGYDIPHFTFTGGEGYVLPDRGSGTIEFDGELLFEGHGGILETSLSHPTIVFHGSREATLFLDVVGDTMEEVSVNQTDVPFALVSWSRDQESVDEESGHWVVEQAQVTLSDEGSDAFGTYPAGEDMDPLSLELSVEPGCLSGSEFAWWIPGGAVALAALAASVGAAIRRGRKSRELEHP